MIRLNPKNDTVPREALEESAMDGCSRAYFLLDEDQDAKQTLILDAPTGRAFQTAVKNLLGFDSVAVKAAIASGDGLDGVGVPDSARVLVVVSAHERPDTGDEVSPAVDPAPPARVDPVENAARIREAIGEPEPAPEAPDPPAAA